MCRTWGRIGGKRQSLNLDWAEWGQEFEPSTAVDGRVSTGGCAAKDLLAVETRFKLRIEGFGRIEEGEGAAVRIAMLTD